MPSLLIYTTTYAPWREGDDEREKLNGSERTLLHEEEDGDPVLWAARVMEGEGVIECSSSAWHRSAWYACEGYEHPHSGVLEEATVHLAGFDPDQEKAVYTLLKQEKVLA
jgi:hypothetical protein